MTRLALWKRLTETDFNAMNAGASPYGDGGGARHIALGVSQAGFHIDSFLLSPGADDILIVAESKSGGASDLNFHSNPARRGGEWYIRDQFTHRHPAWTAAAGFPVHYDPSNPPVIFIVVVGTRFFARFEMADTLAAAGAAVPAKVLAEAKGIVSVDTALASVLSVPEEDTLDAFEEQAQTAPISPFDPANVADGRKQIFAGIFLRQGQATFRKKLLAAYGGRCAITRTALPWILEAAHIVPYKGIDTNSVQNGILLRADIHTLFDLGLVAIDPTTMKARTSSLISDSLYAKIDGKPLLMPTKLSDRPSALAISAHFEGFRE